MKIVKLKILVVIFTLVNVHMLQAQVTATPVYARLDSFLNAAVKNQWVPGSTALVMKDNKVVFEQTIGYRDRENNALLKSTDIFRIASMTKPIVTVAAMILIEKGKLKLDDPISKFIPAFADMKVLKTYDPKTNIYTVEPAKTAITVKHLMTHTSGIGTALDDKIVGTLYTKNGISALMFADSATLACLKPWRKVSLWYEYRCTGLFD